MSVTSFIDTGEYKVKSDTKKEITSSAKKTDKKPAWEIRSPEELVSMGYDPISAGLMATGQQLSAPLYKGINTALAGLPEKALQARGLVSPDIREIRAGISPKHSINIKPALDLAAQATGFIKGAPLMAGRALAGAIGVGGVGGAALKGAVEYGTAVGITTPEKEKFSDIKSRALRTAGAAAVGGAIGTASGIVTKYVNALKQPELLKTGELVRGAKKDFAKSLSETYEKNLLEQTLANPDKKVNISDVLSILPRKMEDVRKVRSLANVSPRLKKAMDGDGQLSLKQSQDLINQLKETISSGKLAGRGVRPSDAEVLDVVRYIEKAQLKSFPEMAKINNWYGRQKDYVKSIESIDKFGSTLSGLKRMFENPETKESLKNILPPDVYDRALATSQAMGVSGAITKGIFSAIKYALIYGAVRNLAEQLKPEDSGVESLSGE